MRIPAGLVEEPYRFDFLGLMRRLERENPDKPRLGDAGSLREEFAALGQHLYMDFPASTVARAETARDGRLRVLVKFLGLLGPQGALPLAVTEEAFGWQIAGDESFPRFLDLFEHRFLQLFFRAWADARPIAQHDRPRDDRFFGYVGAPIGLGLPSLRDLDSVPDMAKLAYAGLIGASARSPARLRGLLEGFFGVRVDVDEFVGARLALAPEERSRLGRRFSSLGVDALAGAAVFSVEDRITVRIHAEDLAQYARFLPAGDLSDPLDDAIFFVLGHEIEWSVELAIPQEKIEPVRLSRFGQLGWTSWLSPDPAGDGTAERCDARIVAPKRHRRRRQTHAKRGKKP